MTIDHEDYRKISTLCNVNESVITNSLTERGIPFKIIQPETYGNKPNIFGLKDVCVNLFDLRNFWFKSIPENKDFKILKSIDTDKYTSVASIWDLENSIDLDDIKKYNIPYSLVKPDILTHNGKKNIHGVCELYVPNDYVEIYKTISSVDMDFTKIFIDTSGSCAVWLDKIIPSINKMKFGKYIFLYEFELSILITLIFKSKEELITYITQKYIIENYSGGGTDFDKIYGMVADDDYLLSDGWCSIEDLKQTSEHKMRIFSDIWENSYVPNIWTIL